MSTADQIRALEELAAIDDELRGIDEVVDREKETLNSLRSTLEGHKAKMAADEAQAQELDKVRVNLVNELRVMMQQVDASRDKLNRSRTERESNAATRELEELRKLIRDREDEVNRIATEIDAVREQVEETGKLADGVQADLDARQSGIESSVAEGEERGAKRRADRAAAMKRVPTVLYRRYEMIRQKRGNALAYTETGTCAACHMALPPQLFHRLRREPLLEQCPSCHRLIYFRPPAKASEGADA